MFAIYIGKENLSRALVKENRGTGVEFSLKELRYDILSCFFRSLKIVVNWKETFK